MKIIQYDSEGKVVDILNARTDVTMETIATVDSIPEYVHKEGYHGVLKYNTESGLYWEYVENPVIEDENVSTEEALNIILEGEN